MMAQAKGATDGPRDREPLARSSRDRDLEMESFRGSRRRPGRGEDGSRT